MNVEAVEKISLKTEDKNLYPLGKNESRFTTSCYHHHAYSTSIFA